MIKFIFYITFLLTVNTVNANNNLLNNQSQNNKIIQHGFEPHAEYSLKNWSYVLNPQGIKILPRPKDPSNHAALIEIHGSKNYLWKNRNDLRVELQQKPKSTLGGENTTVSWQFMLPQLFSNEVHQIAYWESDKSYQQSLQLQLQQGRLSLVSSIANKELWSKENIKPKQWYSIELTVNWSIEQGNITLLVDGQNVINTSVQTLISRDESMFFQLGILRQQTNLIEQIWLDDFQMFNH